MVKLKYTFYITIFLIIRAYLFLLIVVILMMAYFNFDSYFVFVFGIGYLINVIPGLYLHLEYLHANRNIEYNIDYNNIRVKNRDGDTNYSKDEISKIIIYMCPSVFKNSGYRVWAIEDYYYARIMIKNGDELIISCLLTSKIEETLKVLEGVEIIRRKEIFCTLSLGYRG